MWVGFGADSNLSSSYPSLLPDELPFLVLSVWSSSQILVFGLPPSVALWIHFTKIPLTGAEGRVLSGYEAWYPH